RDLRDRIEGDEHGFGDLGGEPVQAEQEAGREAERHRNRERGAEGAGGRGESRPEALGREQLGGEAEGGGGRRDRVRPGEPEEALPENQETGDEAQRIAAG